MKQLSLVFWIAILVSIACAQAQRPIIISWDKNSESDMWQYLLFYDDVESDSLNPPPDSLFNYGDSVSQHQSKLIANVFQPTNTDTFRFSFKDTTYTFYGISHVAYLHSTPNEKDKWGQFGAAAMDSSGNVSRVAVSNIFFMKNLPPGSPNAIKVIVVGIP